MNNNNTIAMTIIAQALCENAKNYKNGVINAKTINDYAVANKWSAEVEGLRITAYKCAEKIHNNVGKAEEMQQLIDYTCMYKCVKSIIDIIGEVNGMKLAQKSMADAALLVVSKTMNIDITPEMAHARSVLKEARKAYKDNESEANEKKLEEAKDEVKRLEGLPGNCKKIFTIADKSKFKKDFELIIGNAIAQQAAKSAAEIEAELKAKAEERKAKAKARKAKKAAEKKAQEQAKAQAKAEEQAAA